MEHIVTLGGKERVMARVAKPSDRNHVLATWKRSMWKHVKGVRKSAFFDFASPAIDQIADQATVVVACPEDSPDTVYGWIAVLGGRPVWFYVLYGMRGVGIYKALREYVIR